MDVVAAEIRVVVRDEESLGALGQLLRAVITGALKDPERVRVFEKMRVVMTVEPAGHPESSFTMDFSGGRVVMEGGSAPGAQIVLRCPTQMLLRLAAMPAAPPQALKYLLTPEGRDLGRRLLTGEVRIFGVPAPPVPDDQVQQADGDECAGERRRRRVHEE